MRLRRSADFDRVARGRRRLDTPHLSVRYVCTGEPARIGLTVSRKVGNAVVRNRVKRWLRQAVRRSSLGASGFDLVFVAKNAAPEAGFEVVAREVADAIRRVEAACGA